MNKALAVSIAVSLSVALASPLAAGGAKTVTVEGKVVCARCSLHQDGQDLCQNVLVVEKKGKQKYFYLTKNEVYEEFGEICHGSKLVRVTGGVTKSEDGKKWLAASQITPVGDKG